MDITLQPKQQIAFTTEACETLYGGAAGGGKLLALDTPLPTPHGWTTMGEIQVGDSVFDEIGEPCTVIAKSDVEREKTYRVIFSDGSQIVAGENHQWVTRDINERQRSLRSTPQFRAQRRANRPSKVSGRKSAAFTASLTKRNAFKSEPEKMPLSGIRRTSEIAATLKVRGRVNHCIDVCQSLKLPEAELLVEPYALGAWLGDGTTSAGQITGYDEEVFQSVANFYEIKTLKSLKTRTIFGLSKHLRQIGVFGNKHIPPAYLRGSTEQRLALLQGLMDTDGTCDTRGHPSFCTTNQRLRDGIIELLNSLGIKAVASVGAARLEGRYISPKWTIHFLTNLPVFRIARKLIRQKRSDWRGTHDVRYITRCEEINPVPMRCITVDSDSHCYLAGQQMIPTHNSLNIRASAIRWCTEVPGIQVYLFRRTLRDLRDNHLRGPMSFFFMLGELIKSGHVKHREVTNEFVFWNGSIIHLCYCDSESDVEGYRGAEMHVLMMDELTHFTEFQYRFLRHRVRIAGLTIPPKYKSRLPRIESASNPGGIGHAWVKRTFISPKPPMEVWRCSPDEGGMLRQYIPAKLADNTYLTRDDPNYADRLRGMGSDHLVRAILDGDWDIVAGQAFEKLRRDVHGLEPFEPPEDCLLFGSLDWGSSRPFAFAMWCVSHGMEVHGKWIQKGAIIQYDEWYGWTGKPNDGLRLEVAEVADGIKGKWNGRRPAYIVADPSMWKVDGSPSHAETMLGRGVVMRKADNARIAGYLAVRDRIAGNEDGPMLYATTNCHAGFWRTMPDIVMDERNVEDVETKSQEEHHYDSVRYACGSRPWVRVIDKPKIKRDTWDIAFDQASEPESNWKTQ